MGHDTNARSSTKNGDRYDDVMRYFRVKISFLILNATLLCLRGSRVIKKSIEGWVGMTLVSACMI